MNIGVPPMTVSQLLSSWFYNGVSADLLATGNGYDGIQCHYTLIDEFGCTQLGLNMIQFVVFEWEYYG